MSMLSAQVDRLRELATRCDELQVGAVKAVTMPSDMGSILREAADTIWQLRDDLQRANAENAKLREQGARLFDKTLELGTENAKLRELCADAWHLFTEHGAVNPCDLPVVDAVRERMRELGVEVPDGD